MDLPFTDPSPVPSKQMPVPGLSVLTVCLMLAATGCSSSDDAVDAELRIEHDGLTRLIDVHVPEGVGGDEPVDLLIAFHGAGSSGSAFMSAAGLDGEADRGGFITAYPTATGVNWAEGCGCVRPDIDGVDDVGFADVIPAAIEDDLDLTIRNVYAVGYSQGGIFVHHLACERADRYAGFAVVAGLMSVPVRSSCEPAAPVSVLGIHGSQDAIIPFTGVPTGSQALVGAVETMVFWKDNAGCQTVDRSAGVGGLDVRSWSDCEMGAGVELIEILRGGHAWPRSGAVDTPAVISEFFKLR